MIKIPKLENIYSEYATCEKSLLVITATLLQSIVMYDPVYLDNLLARAVLDKAGVNVFEMDKTLTYDLPVPLTCLWNSGDGLPLWAASTFQPVGAMHKDAVYFHKRLGKFEFSKKQPKSNVGRWMDRRIPKTAYQSETHQWRAFCYGNAHAIKELLPFIPALGKHRNVGYGEIASWDVSEWVGSSIDTVIQSGKLLHALPVEAANELGVSVDGSPSLVGWTCPRWKPDLFSMRWRIGSAACAT